MSQSEIVRFAFALTVVCALFSASFASDTTTFKVDSYLPERLVDFEWEVDGGFDFSGDNEDSEYYGLNEPNPESRTFERDSDYRNLELASTAHYFYRNLHRSFDVKGYFSFRFVDSEYGSDSRDEQRGGLFRTEEKADRSEVSDYRVSITPTFETREYLLGGLYGDLRLGGHYEYRQDIESYEVDSSLYYYERSDGVIEDNFEWVVQDTKGDDKTCNFDAEFALGWGHVYDGRYAATALNIVGELKDAGLLSREPGYDEMMLLAENIHRYRESFFIDSRLHRMEVLEGVITFLRDIGVIETGESVVQYLVQDIWDYFPDNDSRQFGFSISGGVGVQYNRRSSQTSTMRDVYRWVFEDSAGVVDTIDYVDARIHLTSYRMSSTRSPYLIGNITYSWPINLRWQLDASADVQWFTEGRTTSRSFSGEGKSDIESRFDVGASIAAKYLHDARTSIRLHASYSGVNRSEFIYRWYNMLAPAPDRRYTWELNIGSSIQYRISVPTTLNVSAYHKWHRADDWNREQNSRDYNFSLSLSHHIF